MLKKIGIGLLIVLGIYLIIRGIVELFIIDYSDSTSYRDDWGGPSIFGVLLVHVGPGILAAGLMILAWRKRKSKR